MKKKSLMAFISILCFAFNFSAKATTISTNTTWSTPGSVPTITGNLEIANGATLTITGGFTCDVPANIIIDAGGQLVVTGTLTVLYLQWEGISANPFMIKVSAGNSTTQGGRLLVENYATVDGDYHAATTNPFITYPNTWGGIYVAGLGNSTYQSTKSGMATFTNHATVQHAQAGVTNFDYSTDPTGKTTSGGIIHADNSSFIDNWTDVVMLNYTFTTVTGTVLDDQSYFKLCNFYAQGSIPLFSPNDYSIEPYEGYQYEGYVAYLKNIDGVKFLGCSFENTADEPICGIGAYNAGFNLTHNCTTPSTPVTPWGTTCSGGVETRGSMSGFNDYNWGSVYVVNSLNFHKVAICYTDFSNTGSGSDIPVYSVYLSGCLNPVITNNTVSVPGSSIQTSGFSLHGCNGYTFQQNTFTGYGNGGSTDAIGAVIQSSGPNYNLANNNTFQNLNYAQQAEDINRLSKSPGGATGLEMLCNSMSSNTLVNNTDISVVYSLPSLLTNDGVHPSQGHQSSSGFTDAENTFSSAALYNFYNTCQSVKYYASSSSLPDYPVNKSGATTQIAAGASCVIPTGISVIPILSHSTYVAHIGPALTAVAAYVTGGSGHTVSDPNPFLTPYCRLVDSVSNGFLYGDTTSKLDSIAMVLQSLPYNYDYQVQLAGLYVQQNNFALALTTLSNIITTDTLDTTTNKQLTNLIYAYGIMGKLYSDTSSGDSAKWHHLTTGKIDTLTGIDTTDASYAQVVTHYLFSRYTNNFYEPVWQEIGGNNNDVLGQLNRMAQVMQETEKNGIQVYPNPLNNTLNINLFEGRQCQYRLMDASGRTILTNSMQTGLNIIDTHALQPGFYLLEVSGNGMTTYRQKLLKK
ncbi:MAG TPA: T9SS type A sorting domain-containing protein [Flavipsychrobacter sp.]|nr:T9SS type A sorting domain-containing protein [Flavipsychrobacter sp.]